MRQLQFILVLIVQLLVSVSAAEEPSQRHFTVCSHELPPHTFPTAEGKAGGYASAVLLAVADKLGWSLQIQYAPWMRARMDSQEGVCDLIYTILKTPEYERFFVFPEEALADRYNVLIVRKDSGIQYDGNLESFMRQHSVGLYKDKVVSPEFDRLRSTDWARVEEKPRATNIMKMLLAGRFDAAIENRATALYELAAMGHSADITILSPPLSVLPSYIAFSKKGRAVPYLADFNRELKAFKTSPAYTALQLEHEEMRGP